MAARLTSSKAYKIFLDELADLLEDLAGPFSSWPSAGDCAQLGRRFHMLKGGAGFFGLDELSSAAGELETVFLKSTLDDSTRLEQALALIEALKRVAAGAPSFTGQP